jgi:hypothetical protein
VSWLTLAWAIIVIAQAAYWLMWHDRTKEMDEAVWRACVYYDTERKVQS